MANEDNLKSSNLKEPVAKVEEDDFENLLENDTTEDSEIVPYDSQKVKLKWSRVIIVSFVLAIFTAGLTLLTMWIIISKNENKAIYLLLEIILLIECGVFFTFGGCVGTFKQSFTINRLRFRKNKEKQITGADTKIAIASSYTYVFAGILLGLMSLIAHFIIANIPSDAFI